MIPRSADDDDVEYDRRVLIIDGEDGALQQLAIELMGRNFAVHYANDPAEALLLAQEARGQIGAVLFVSSPALGRIPDMARRLSVAPASLIPIGDRPEPREIAAMAFHGVRWHLWDDPSNETIRFVLTSVLSEQDPMELRFDLRVPTRVPASLEIDDLKGEVTIRDLSPGGACLLGQIVGDVGARGRLCFTLGDTPLELPLRVAWRVEGASDDVGVGGIAFTEVDPEAGAALDEHIESVLTRQHVTRPEA
jgi:hypothetical protein